MATTEFPVSARSKLATASAPVSYARPLAVVTTLFFMWGFLTCLNDILVPHLKAIFDLSYAKVMLVQFAFFSAYFLFSIPWSRVVNTIGYQKTMVVGLLTMAVGSFLFLPAASAASYPLFLTALMILAAGITGLQVAANPYVVVLGKPETASSRLDLTQAFNSLGTTIAPKVGGLLILAAAPLAIAELHQLTPQALHAYRVQEAASVKLPYSVIGVALILLAVLIGSFKLPKIDAASFQRGAKTNDSIWKHPNLVLGSIAIFTYVGAEVSIGSFLVNYLGQSDIAHLSAKAAAGFVSFYWGGAMVGRFVGAGLLGRFKPGSLLGLCAIFAALLVLISMAATGHVAMWTILGVGLFNSIMFPTIFSLGVAELGPLTGNASGLLNMAIVGGAILPVLQGMIADRVGIHHAFVLPVICYLYILYYGLSGSRANSQRYKTI
ncbi:MAG TPA: sugar MFS transporter [Candidatus Binatia bacterium]|nr:sugar MFS transporter [Candidatus Binatia bacterium]